MPKKIAVTGGIGSGKSTAINCLKEMGYAVFSCDEIYKELILSSEYIQKIKEAFPSVVLNGIIDRKLLSDIVFRHPNRRRTLNDIAHPLIMDRLFEYMNSCPNELVFAEVPLLFEGNFENKFDAVIVIYRDIETRIKAIQTRDGLSKEAAVERIRSQFDYHSKEGMLRLNASRACIVDNNSTRDDLYQNLSITLAKL